MIYGTGEVSSGTMRSADLLDAFASALIDLARRNLESGHIAAYHAKNDFILAGRAQMLAEIIEARQTDETEQEADLANEEVNSLVESLEAYAAPYCYFGANEGFAYVS